MTDFDATVAAWSRADREAIHPTGTDDDNYRASGHAAAQRIADLLDVFADRPVRTICDFGCGDGRVLQWLAEMFPVAIGIDASYEMLVRAQVRALSAHTWLWDGRPGPDAPPRALVWRWGHVDVVAALAVLIHHRHADAAQLVASLTALVRPGGLLLLDLPLYEEGREPESWIDVATWTLPEWLELAHALDLETLQASVSPGAFSYETVGAAHDSLIVARKRP